MSQGERWYVCSLEVLLEMYPTVSWTTAGQESFEKEWRDLGSTLQGRDKGDRDPYVFLFRVGHVQ